jgi:hypothetical protein
VGDVEISDPSGEMRVLKELESFVLRSNGFDFIEGARFPFVTGFQWDGSSFKGAFFEINFFNKIAVVSYQSIKLGDYKLYGVFRRE